MTRRYPANSKKVKAQLDAMSKWFGDFYGGNAVDGIGSRELRAEVHADTRGGNPGASGKFTGSGVRGGDEGASGDEIRQPQGDRRRGQRP
jgi:hypothetical protein